MLKSLVFEDKAQVLQCSGRLTEFGSRVYDGETHGVGGKERALASLSSMLTASPRPCRHT